MAKNPRRLEVPGETRAAKDAAPVDESSNALDEARELIPPEREEIEYVPEPIIDATPKGLPNASDVDPKTIKTMTLTNQGYVLPEAAVHHANN